jgi:hypothetical protein
MNRRRCRRWPAVVLPFFVLRAMVPVGFMWAPLEGGEFIRLCDGLKSPLTAPVIADKADRPAPVGHEHASAMGHGHHHGADSSTDDHRATRAGHGGGDAGHEDTGQPGPVCPFWLASVSFADGPSYVAFEVPWAPDAPPMSRTRADKDREFALPIRIRGPPFLPA